jgi:hypothetical protein
MSSEARLTLNQRPPRTDDHAAAALMEPGRAEVRTELTAVDAALQLGRAPTSVKRRAPTRRRLRVEKHRKRQLRCDAFAHLERTGQCTLAIAGVECDDGYDVRRADSRMRTLVLPKVDALERNRYGCE